MRLFSMRHGKTVPAVNGNDRARMLTEEGRAMVRQTARHLRDLRFRPSTVVVSSALRAKETGGILISELGIESGNIICESGLYSWDEMLAAVDSQGFDDVLQKYYKGPFHEDLMRFEENRMQAFKDALSEIHGDVLVVSHAWVAQTVIMAAAPALRDEVRNVHLPEAHGILLEKGTMHVIGPNGKVD